MHALQGEFESVYKKTFGVKKLNEAQQMFVHAATKAIVVNEAQDQWKEKIQAYINDPKGKNIPPEVITELSSIAAEFSTPEKPIDAWTAVALYKSKKSEE
jgi:hypothetical protein